MTFFCWVTVAFLCISVACGIPSQRCVGGMASSIQNPLELKWWIETEPVVFVCEWPSNNQHVIKQLNLSFNVWEFPEVKQQSGGRTLNNLLGTVVLMQLGR